MNVTETFRPLQGEVALDVAPRMALRVDTEPALKRARFGVGRVLTPQVLQDEQEARSQRTNGLMQALATGVVRGFETPYVQGPTGGARIDVSPGIAMAHGEDVILPATARLPAHLISVAHESLESAGPVWTDIERRALRDAPSWPLGALAARFAGRGLPSVAVLIARPIRLLRDLSPHVGGPCHDDPDPASQRLAFEDALRFEWVLWPHRDRPLPGRDAAWRNRLAWRVFDGEAQGLVWPWQALGVPIALAGFDDMASGRLAFLDSQSVMREGGGLRARSPLVRSGLGAGLNEPLAQAQVLQLSEQLAELPADQLTVAHLARLFDRLPPAGLLPSSVVDVGLARQNVFPPSWSVSAQVITDDMVETLVAESARLAPLSLSRAEQVELLVPVPAAQYHPDLLRLDEPVDPLFAITIGGLERRRAKALRERAGWQHRHDVLAHAISGIWPERLANDPLGLADERFDGLSFLAANFFPRLHTGGKPRLPELEAHGFDGAQDTLVLAPGDKLMAYVEIDRSQPPQHLFLQPLVRNTVAPTSATALDTAVMSPGPLFWWGAAGAPQPTVPGVPTASLLFAGNLPVAVADPSASQFKRWLRLEVDVSFFAPNAAQVTLEGLVYGAVCGANGQAVRWGHAGAVRADRERHWVAETLPQGANVRVAAGTLAAADGDTSAPWPWDDEREPGEAQAALEGFSIDAALTTHELPDVSALITQAQGNPALQELVQTQSAASTAAVSTPRVPNQRALHQGLARLVEQLDRKSRASNDLVEFGFLRSRVDLYRLRTRLLGADDADRLLTSPAISDLVKRSESSYATDQQLTEYLNKASVTASAVPTSSSAASTAATAAAASGQPTPRVNAVAAASGNAVAFTAVGLSAPRALASNLSALTSTRSLSGTGGVSSAVSAPAVASGLVFNPAAAAIGSTSSTSAALLAARSRLESGIKLGTAGQAVPGKSVTPPSVELVAAASNFNLSQNSVTLGERLKTPVVVDTWSAAAAGKTASVDNTVAQLTELRLPVGSLPVFGYQATTTPGQTKAVGTVADLRAAGANLINIDQVDTDIKFEADYFRKGIDAVDNSIRFLRGVEGLVESYRRLRDMAQAALARLQSLQQRTLSEISRLDKELAEVRHDLGVARSLLAEERQRIAALIEHRKAVLAQVPYVVFRRPRLANRLDDLPVRSVETGLYVSPVPACQGHAQAIPPDLQRMVDALRDLPARHFNRLSELLLSIDNRHELSSLLRTATDRARVRTTSLAQASAALDRSQSGVAGAVQALQFSFLDIGLQHASMVVQQAPASSGLAQLAWSELSMQALTHVAVGDLFHSSRTLGASGELDDIARVAACLHRSLGSVPPAVRLTWALRLSSFDVAPSLRQLSVLPQFGDHSLGLDFSDWHGMQDMVDWLFSRIDARSNPAVRLINDLVRVIILLASHAPVRDLIPARLAQPIRPVIGAFLQLNIDALSEVRVGMQVSLGQGAAQAVVHDVSPGRVVARVIQAAAAAPTLDTDTVVHLSASKGQVSVSAFTARSLVNR
jgi:hypothetical protein